MRQLDEQIAPVNDEIAAQDINASRLVDAPAAPRDARIGLLQEVGSKQASLKYGFGCHARFVP